MLEKNNKGNIKKIKLDKPTKTEAPIRPALKYFYTTKYAKISCKVWV